MDHGILLIKTIINSNLFQPPFSCDHPVLWHLAKNLNKSTSGNCRKPRLWYLKAPYLAADAQQHPEHLWMSSFGKHSQAFITNQDFPSKIPNMAKVTNHYSISHILTFLCFSLTYYILFLTLAWHFFHIYCQRTLTIVFFLPITIPQNNTMSTPSNTLRHSPAFGTFQIIPMITLRPPTPSFSNTSTDTILISSIRQSPTTSWIALPQYPPASYWPTTPFVSSMVETVPTLILDLLLCPNVDCNIKTQHTYHSMMLTPSLQHQQLCLSQFPLGQSPLPRTNCWMLASKPEQLLQQGDEYFLLEYRVVWLQHVTELQEMDQDWEIFFGVDPEENSRKVTIVASKTWVAVARHPAPTVYTKFLYIFFFSARNLFHFSFRFYFSNFWSMEVFWTLKYYTFRKMQQNV